MLGDVGGSGFDFVHPTLNVARTHCPSWSMLDSFKRDLIRFLRTEDLYIEPQSQIGKRHTITNIDGSFQALYCHWWIS
jgi:hypothetical protein